MYSVGLLDNLRTRPGVKLNRPIPTIPVERKPLPTLPPIVGDMRYIPTITMPSLNWGRDREPARCMAMTPECMGREKWEKYYGANNPGRRFLNEHLQERRRMATEVPRTEISEPNGNNPSTM